MAKKSNGQGREESQEADEVKEPREGRERKTLPRGELDSLIGRIEVAHERMKKIGDRMGEKHVSEIEVLNFKTMLVGIKYLESFSSALEEAWVDYQFPMPNSDP